MNLVIDTNIVFSTLLNPHSAIGEILMNIQDDFTFFAPELLKEELSRYSSKIAAYTKITNDNLADIETLVLSNITFVAEEQVDEQSWKAAFNLTKNIDEDDTPFVALAIHMNARLWTGDKILAQGLSKKGANLIITTSELKKLI